MGTLEVTLSTILMVWGENIPQVHPMFLSQRADSRAFGHFLTTPGGPWLRASFSRFHREEGFLSSALAPGCALVR